MKKILLLSLCLIINWLIYRGELKSAWLSFQGQNLISDVKLGKLWGNFDKLRTEAVEFSGWSAKDNIDLSLDPQTKGVAIYEFTQPEEARKIILQIALAKPSPGSNKISVSTDQNNWQTVGENKYYHLVPLDITKFIGNQDEFWVKIEANNEALTGPPAIILYDLYLMFYRHPVNLPPLVLFFTSVFFPVLLIFWPGKKKAVKLCLFGLVIGLSLRLSLQNLAAYRYHSFDSDVICLTQEVPRFLSLDILPALLGNYCGNKESFNPLIIIGFWKVFGYGSEMAIRFSSLIFHWLTIIFVFYYGNKVISFAAGITAAGFVGSHPYLVELSARGLRDTAFTFIVLIFVFLLWETNLKKWRNLTAIFLTAVFSIYLRLHSLIQLTLLVLLRRSFGVIFLLGLISAPLIVNNLKTYGTWNYSEQMHLKWNANVEFAGKPGFPSKEAVTINPFQGPEISAMTYFFRFHTIPDLIISTVQGIRKTFSDLYFKNNNYGLILFIGGGWLMVRQKRLRYILILTFLLEVPHFFLVSKNLVEFRSMTQSLPFIGLTIGYIIDRLWKKLTRC